MADQFRWTASKPLGRDDPVEQGETFEPTDAERRAYSDLMSPVESEPDNGDEDAGEGDDRDLEELTHDELKELAEERRVADEIDLRSKGSIIDALEE
ncbi:hypothetical protein [Halalkalicoccus sp. NIPERK01]|uniref:hypothetical protein n=1 Tax=Halalkalicoccus sp. NIPERK01 TaxID=3053469 RepID=UPI00256EC1D6|nr:hypothetical protein [Halalkalicoccus sp. NIPERK01]MDL5361356.1 hypothetical protein [Halalkalicoccus sp. NIPERK01]